MSQKQSYLLGILLIITIGLVATLILDPYPTSPETNEPPPFSDLSGSPPDHSRESSTMSRAGLDQDVLIAGHRLLPYSEELEVIRPVEPSIAQSVDFSRNAKPWIFDRRAVRVNFEPLFAARDERSNVLFFDVGQERPIQVNLDRRMIRGPKSFSITGKVPADPYSNVMLTVEEDVTLANIRTSKGYFQVRYMGDQVHEVRKFDEHKVHPCSTPHDAESEADEMGDSEPPSGTSGDTTSSDDGTQFDVLVVYTTDAVSKVGGTNAMVATVNLAIDETNIAYQESQVSPKLRLVHHESVSYDVKDSSVSLAALRSTSDGILDHVHTLRDTYGADLVAMLQDIDGFCGRAYVMTNLSPGFASNAFSVTDYDCATGYYSFGHEIGHNLGCKHGVGDGGTSQGSGLFPYSHGWRWTGTNSVQYRSILAYSPGIRIQRFSNPNVLYQGVATGRPTSASDQAYNALSINNAAVVASQWRTVTTGPTEDNYEPNNTQSSAYDISNHEGILLSSLNGFGKQNDDDWYKIYASSGFGRIVIDCTFNHAEGDINIRLVDETGTILATSTSTSDNESIDFTVSNTGQHYYIQVYFDDNGNSYDLEWDDLISNPSSVPEIRLTSGDGTYTISSGSTLVNSSSGTLFPNTALGSTATNSFRIYNDGTANLTVNASDDSPHFSISLDRRNHCSGHLRDPRN